jgi:hypothetical protein
MVTILILLIGAIIGSLLTIGTVIVNDTETTLGKLMVDEADRDAKQCYVVFSKEELQSMPEGGYVRLKIKTFNSLKQK